jgi:hypothetical protein
MEATAKSAGLYCAASNRTIMENQLTGVDQSQVVELHLLGS